jgi:hypothetical protein
MSWGILNTCRPQYNSWEDLYRLKLKAKERVSVIGI